MITDSTASEVSTDNAVVRGMPIPQRIDWLMEHARRHSVEFQSPAVFWRAATSHSTQPSSHSIKAPVYLMTVFYRSPHLPAKKLVLTALWPSSSAASCSSSPPGSSMMNFPT